MGKEIKQVMAYFANFDYVPTIDEIHRFFPEKIKKNTLGEYRIKIKNLELRTKNFQTERLKKKRISERKIEKIKKYVSLLARFPQIELIGLSGTVAMNNAQKKDDIDLFIITGENQLWTGRFIATFLALVLGIKRPRHINRDRLSAAHFKDKVCLNLFFDAGGLLIPKNKQTEYVAHEVLQMRPLVSKNQAYERFLAANNWVYRWFPNARPEKRLINTDTVPESSSSWMEWLAKKLQLVLINRHRTTEMINDTQLWFFPDDFELKYTDLHERSRKTKLHG